MYARDLCLLSATDILALYTKRKLSPVEVVEACLQQIEDYNGSLNAVVTLAPSEALEKAKQSEVAIMRGERLRPLQGLPCLVKDNIATKGIRTTSGSLLFKSLVPEEDAGVIASAKRNGAIILGKTNTPAFGWTGTTDNKVFGPTRNPFDLTRTPGGSSGGAAVASAMAFAPVNIGTDGGGSLRIPASFTGTVGFKPSHGRVPDVPPHTHWLFQHYGPIARSVEDIRLIMSAIAGPDSRDPHSLSANAAAGYPARGHDAKPRILFTTQLGWIGAIDPEVATHARASAMAFRELGWEVVERDINWSNPSPFANVIAGFGLLSRLQGHEHRVGEIEDGILAIIESVKKLPNTSFYDAYAARNAWCAQVFKLFDDYDFLITPTTACTPFELGNLYPDVIAGQPALPSDWSPYLRVFNITGLPAISLPAGLSRDGLPIGLQIVGARFADSEVLDAAAAFERIRPWNRLGAIEAFRDQRNSDVNDG